LRNGEAAGLLVEDMGEEESLPVLRVRPYDVRQLKNNEPGQPCRSTQSCFGSASSSTLSIGGTLRSCCC